MISLARVVLSKKLNSQVFMVERSNGKFIKGRWIETPDEFSVFEMQGIIYPSTPRQLVQVPEGDRVEGMIAILTAERLFITHLEGNSRISDKVVWQDESYRVLQSNPYVDYGFWESFATRLIGN